MNISFNSLSFYSGFQSPYSFSATGSAPEASGASQVPSKAQREGQAVSAGGDYDSYECQTCKNRKYQDGSNDPNVSFKSPTRLSPESAAYAIRAHESEHVAHAWAEAQTEDKEILSQSVSYHTDICPECGRTYMSGGTTRTVFRSAPETYAEEPVKKGVYVDLLV